MLEKGYCTVDGLISGRGCPSCRKGHRGAVVDRGWRCSSILKRRALPAAGRALAAAGVEGEGAIVGGSAGRPTLATVKEGGNVMGGLGCGD